MTSGCCCHGVALATAHTDSARAKRPWFSSGLELIPGWKVQLFVRKNEDPYSDARQHFGSTFCGGQ